MCESTILNQRNTRNLYVPILRKNSNFRSESQFFSVNKVEILNFLATNEKLDRDFKAKDVDSALL